MPDLFTSPPTDRDQRFNDAAPVSPPLNPVEPFLSEEAEIPLAPILRKPKHTTMHIFTSYCELPQEVTFENQNDNEKILLYLRKEFVTNLSWVSGGVLLLILPVALFFLAPSLFSFLPQSFIIVFTLSYYLLVLSYMFMNFITWYFNINLITNERIVDIDFEDLVYKNVAETKLSLVQDVSYTQIGAIRTVFDFGDVLIQTAGTIDNFDLHGVPFPERIVNVVEDLIGKGGRHA